jgi:hypothetical protein
MKLTENFSLSEVFDWGKWQGLSATDNAKLTEWQKRDWNEKIHLPQAKAIAEDLQDIRDLVNKMFHEYNGKNRDKSGFMVQTKSMGIAP